MAINWEAVEAALFTWVQTASGLNANNVIWSDQDFEPPDDDYVTLRLGDLVRVGQDGLTHIFDAGQPNGEEIEFRTKGVREFVVSVNAFTNQTGGGTGARALLDKIQAALALPSKRDALNAAGVGVLDEGRVQNLSQLGAADFVGRATLEVRMMITQTASEKTGYIATAVLVDHTGEPGMQI
jgi:hypothetical protein